MLSSTTVRATVQGSGSAGPFSFLFRIFAATDLDVRKTSAVGAVTALAYPTDYTVAGVGDAAGGTLTLSAPLATGETLTILRSTANTQPTSLRTLGTFLPGSHEDAFDRLTMIAQEHQDALDRAVTLPVTFAPGAVSAELPIPEAGKALVWNGGASAIENRAISDGAVTLPGGQRTVTTLSDYIANNAVERNVKDYGAILDGQSHPLSTKFATLAAAQAVYPDATSLTDELDWAATQRAVDASARGDRILLPGATAVFNRTLQVNTPYLTFIGLNGVETSINFTGTGACVQLGSDNGHAFDAADYDGVQGVGFEDIALGYTGTATSNLTDGQGTYGTGTYGIRDWRGGSVRFKNVTLQNFDYPFWGIQSDVNRWSNVTLAFNHSGCYFGPRSDQATIDHVWSFDNDIVWALDSCRGFRCRGWQTDNDGSASTYPAKITDSFNRGVSGIVFDSPWLEHFGGPAVVPAFFGIGMTGATAIGSVTIRDPLVFTNSAGASPYTSYLAEASVFGSIRIAGVHGQPFFLTAVVHTTNAATAYVTIDDPDTTSMTVVKHDGTGTLELLTNGSRNATYTTSGTGNLHHQQMLSHGTSSGFRSNNGRWRGGLSTANTQRDWALSGSENPRQLDFFYPEDVTSGNPSLVSITRRIAYGGANPSLGVTTWAAGDLQWNNGGSFGNPLLWKCVTAGTPGSWETVVLPSLAADSGDASVNPTWGAAEQFIRFNTALTAARAVNLQANQIDGNAWFLVVRDTGATGAFNIVVKDQAAATIATLTAPGQSCLVAYDRGSSTWRAIATWVSQLPLFGSKTQDWASLATGAQQSTTVTATGAALGDYVETTMDVALSGTRLWGEVTAADTVTVYQRNDTGGAVDVASGTLRVRVVKKQP